MNTEKIDENIELTTLDNGIRVVTDKFPHLESVCISAAFAVGSCFETPDNNGVAHFLEHILFKDSKTGSADDRQRKIAESGGFLNASTEKDRTSYRAVILRDDHLEALNVLGDMICEPAFSAEQIETERGVILQEGCRGCRSCALRDSFYFVAFPDHGLALPVAGTEESIKTISRDDLIQFHSDYYAAENLIVSISGDVSHMECVDSIARAFAALPVAARHKVPQFKYAGGEASFGVNDDQATIWFGYPGQRTGSQSEWAEYLFWQFCGSGPTSRLFTELREKRGLVYDTHTFDDDHAGAPMRVACATGAAKEAKNIFGCMAGTIFDAADSITDDDVNRLKKSEIAGFRMHRDSASGRVDGAIASLLGYNFCSLKPADDYSKIQNIDAAAIKRAAHALFSSDPTLAVFGPVRQLPKLSMLGDRRRAAA